MAQVMSTLNQINWLMPRGATECNLKIKLSSVLLCLAVQELSNLDVHHASTENCMCPWLCPSLLK